MKRRKSNLATNQKCQGYQPKMSIIPCFCDTVVPGQVMLHSGAGSTTTEHNGLNAKLWCFAFLAGWLGADAGGCVLTNYLIASCLCVLLLTIGPGVKHINT